MTDIRVKPLTSAIGAEIQGIDLRDPISDDDAAVLRRAMLDHLALFFRDQDLTVERHREVVQLFGPIVVVPYVSGKPWPGFDDVFTIMEKKGPRGTLAAADEFHTDFSHQLTPVLGISLHAQTVPAAGGDTVFASMYAAYDALSPAMQAFLDPLHAVHTNQLIVLRSGNPNLDYGPVEENVHPVVRIHPETGRKLLYVNVAITRRIVELAQMESDAVLQFLFEHIKEPTFQCRFKWEKNSLAIWDNRSTQHYASADYDEPRRLRRIIIGSDDRPTGPMEAKEPRAVAVG